MSDERVTILRTDVRELTDEIRTAAAALEAWREYREQVRRRLSEAIRMHTRNEVAAALGLAPLMLESVETSGVDEAGVVYLLRAVDRKRALDGMGVGE